jgi:tRNA 2-thiocytidine biosynthesis protein TtcA
MSGVDYRIISTKISEMALDPNAKKNACFICAHHRRYEIYKLAHAENCNKLAFGHHKDDIVETLLLNILYSRKIEGMRIRQEVFQGRMYVIRPLAYLEETLVKKYAERMGIIGIPKMCKMDGESRRQTVKDLIADLQAKEKNANIRSNIFRSLYNVNVGFGPGEDERIKE